MDSFSHRDVPPENPGGSLTHEAHVWLISPAAFAENDQARLLADTLSTEESARADRFIFEKDRTLFTVAHGALRHILSKYTDRKPEAWHFQNGVHGRPEIAPQQNPENLRFNLSHCKGLVACVISHGYDCGVDVEQIGRVRDAKSLAEGFFSSFECQELQKCPSEEDLQVLFCRYWTLKEAYIKALGKGLSMALDNFFFTFWDNSIQIHFVSDDDQSDREWKLYQVKPTEEHILSVAIRKAEEKRFAFKLFDYQVINSWVSS